MYIYVLSVQARRIPLVQLAQLGMSRNCTVADVLAYMDIPLPEEDDLSGDDFDGYIELMVRVRMKMVMVMMSMEVTVQLRMVMGMTVNLVVMDKTVTMVLMEVLRLWSILGIQVACKMWQTKTSSNY